MLRDPGPSENVEATLAEVEARRAALARKVLELVERPFQSISAERTRAEKEALDNVFALRNALTEEEWKASFAQRKK